MNECPVHHLRGDLPPLIPRIKKLPVDERGYPVPFFVIWLDGKPEFRIADAQKRRDCFKFQLCWVCGEKLGRYKTFVIGPMCAINRVTSEPGCHGDCAEWSVRACPFLAKPQMKRREDDLTDESKTSVPGIMFDRNPGVTCLWTTEKFRLFNNGKNKALVEVGEPDHVSWWRQGRRATKPEVLLSIETGLPELLKLCQTRRDLEDIEYRRRQLNEFLPA